MNLFRSFLIVLFFTFSLHAFITSDVDNSFQSDCSGVNLANAKVIDVNSTECYSIDGGVDGPSNDEDLFILELLKI